jgi:CheY-like chemotaxis protein
MMRSTNPILLVEDDQVDTLIVQRSLKKINIMNPLDIARDGEEALMLLRDPKREKPVIILLDLSMPRMSGLELLRVIKQDESLKRIPVVVLTSSNEDKDKLDSFNLGAAGYIIKPIDFDQFVDVMRTIDLYWTLSELPLEG